MSEGINYIPEPPEVFEPAPQKKKKTLWIIIAIVAIVLLCCCLIGIFAVVLGLIPVGLDQYLSNFTPYLYLV
jgi:hypothetical protein